MKQTVKHIKTRLSNNTKVVENYFFMTSLQLISSAFGILIYPYLIRTLSSETYGQYAFLFAIVAYFIDLTGFGFNLTGMKLITDHLYDSKQKSTILSGIFSAKMYLALLSVCILLPLTLLVPKLQEHRLLLAVLFTQVIAEIAYPQWYFRAIEKMKIVTWYQLFFRIASVPFIFFLVKSPADLLNYAIITTLSVVTPAILLLHHLIKKEQLQLRVVSPQQTFVFVREAFPVFISSFVETVKQESTTLVIGLMLGMREVAIFDLAKKIIMVPRMLLANINVAIFPKLRKNPSGKNIRKIIRYEWFTGLAAVIIVAALGYPAIYLLGGENMLGAYPVSILMSTTLLSWLITGAYIYHVFIPNKQNYLITLNQVTSFLSFGILLIPGILLLPGIYAIVCPLVLSSIAEIVFSGTVIRWKRLL